MQPCHISMAKDGVSFDILSVGNAAMSHARRELSEHPDCHNHRCLKEKPKGMLPAFCDNKYFRLFTPFSFRIWLAFGKLFNASPRCFGCKQKAAAEREEEGRERFRWYE